MANEFFNHEFSGNKVLLLAKQVTMEPLHGQFWGQFADWNTSKNAVPVGPNAKPKVIKSPIVMQNELERKPGDTIEIPRFRQLTDAPKLGNEQMEDYEMVQKVNHVKVYIDVIRNAVTPKDGEMSAQTTKDYELVKNAKPQLHDNYTEIANYAGASWSFYNGYSWNVLTSDQFVDDNNVGRCSHPHIYVAGDGKVTYSTVDYPGTDNYEIAIGTALNTLGSTDVLDTGLLSALQMSEEIRKIPKIVLSNGRKVWGLACHPAQIATLKADSSRLTTSLLSFCC